MLKKIKMLSNICIFISICVGITMYFFPAKLCHSEVSILNVKDYCEISTRLLICQRKSLKKYISILRDRLDKKEQLGQIMLREQQKLKSCQDKVFREYNITSREYHDFYNENKGAIDKYFKNYQEMKPDVKELSREVSRLLQEYEKLLLSPDVNRSERGRAALTV